MTGPDPESNQSSLIGVAASPKKQASLPPRNDSQMMADDSKEEGANERAQAEEKLLMYALGFVILPSINAAAVAPDLQVLGRAK